MLTDRVEGLMRFSRITKYAAGAVCCLTTAGLTAVDSGFTSAVHMALLPVSVVFITYLACGPSWYSWSRRYFRQPVRTAIRMTVLDCLLAGLSLLGIQLLMSSGSGGTIPLGPCMLTTTTVLFLLNRFLPAALSSLLFRRNQLLRILVLGPADATQRIRHQLEVARAVGIEIVDSHNTDDEVNGHSLPNPKHPADTESLGVSACSQIHQHSLRHAIDRVILVSKNTSEKAMELQQNIHRECDAAGLPLTVYMDTPPAPLYSVMPIPADAPVISPTAQEPMQNPVNQVVKRGLDILISVPFVLLVLPPLCLIVRIIHWIQSPGSLFYLQERCGQSGSTFHIFKFRTMHVPKPGQTDLEDDPAPRIFELGAILRASRLDEFPQFLNVLLGTMSVVGPRAHHVQDRIKFSRIVPQYPMRMQAKPGITGPAQYKEYLGVFHRDSVKSRVSCDLDYINRWTIEGDLILMFKTGRVIGESLLRAVFSKLHEQLPITTPAVTLNYPTLDSANSGETPERPGRQLAA